MIESDDPGVDVERLVRKVQAEVARRETEGVATALPFDAGPSDQIRVARGALAIASEKSRVRTTWSSRLAIFPFTIPLVQRALLRALTVLFKDQRHVNLALVDAVQALIAANEALRLRVQALEGESSAPGEE